MIIWLWMLLLAVLALAPLGISLRRKGASASRRDAAMALHQSQLDEIERDRAEGRLPEEEYRAAKLEVQRRLLATDAIVEAGSNGNARGLLIVTGVLVPVVALVLFLSSGLPFVPSEPHASWVKQQDAAAARDNRLIAALQARLARMNPDSAEGREGYVILGQALLERGKTAQAVKAWRVALRAKFDPTLAAETAELEIDMVGHMTPDAKALFKRALAEAPHDAPWRNLVKRRLREASVTLPNAAPGASFKP